MIETNVEITPRKLFKTIFDLAREHPANGVMTNTNTGWVIIQGMSWEITLEKNIITIGTKKFDIGNIIISKFNRYDERVKGLLKKEVVRVSVLYKRAGDGFTWTKEIILPVTPPNMDATEEDDLINCAFGLLLIAEAIKKMHNE